MIDRRVLVSSMRLLATDYRHRRGGMPDLFLWCIAQCDDGSTYCSSAFLEVKSPNDRLAKKQEVSLYCHKQFLVFLEMVVDYI